VHALRSIRQQRLPLVLPSQVRIKYGKRTRCAGYPNEEYDKDAVRRCLEYARRHVKERERYLNHILSASADGVKLGE
jgi:hypothetical protein